MSVVYVLLPLSLVLAGVAVGVFYWAVRSGQMDDLETPALRMLSDDVEANVRKETPDGEQLPA